MQKILMSIILLEFIRQRFMLIKSGTYFAYFGVAYFPKEIQLLVTKI